jgi:hypothetical protein
MMSAIVSFPFSWEKVSGRTFERLFAGVMDRNPGMSFIDQAVLISYVNFDSFEPCNSARLAIEMSATIAEDGELQERCEHLRERVDWLVRDWLAVGDVVFWPEDSQLMVRRGSRSVECDPYIFAIVVSGLFRLRRVQRAAAASILESGELHVGRHVSVDAFQGCIRKLLDGTLDYRIGPHSRRRRLGFTEPEHLKLLLDLLGQDEQRLDC